MIDLPGNPKTFCVFLIDDDEDDQEIFTLCLHQLDPSINCITAMDGQHALEIVNKNDTIPFNPDFIFLDLNMPRLNGKECLTELRKLERFKHTPIYIYSTSSSDDHKTETKALGATGFITKPFTVDELTVILSNLIIPSLNLYKEQYEKRINQNTTKEKE